MNNKGFTLIELLVVIAIIGILASVILSSLNDARMSGIAAKIQTEMDAISKRANIEQVNGLTYDTVCGTGGFPTSTAIVDLIDSIESLASSTVTCNSNPGAYAISAPIFDGHWCVDHAGIRREIGSALGPAEFDCPPS